MLAKGDRTPLVADFTRFQVIENTEPDKLPVVDYVRLRSELRKVLLLEVNRARAPVPIVGVANEKRLSLLSRSEFLVAAELYGATENAGVENAIRSKLQGWKMQKRKMQE